VLVGADVGFDEALYTSERVLVALCGKEMRKRGEERRYPCVVEFGLHADHVALLFKLGAEDIQLRGVERRLRIDRI
jgi:hypothetical protein